MERVGWFGEEGRGVFLGHFIYIKHGSWELNFRLPVKVHVSPLHA